MQKLYIHSNPVLKQKWIDLLNQAGIKHESVLDETFGIFDNEQLIATASRHHNVIKCVAIEPQHQGGALFNQLITHLFTKVFEDGYSQAYVYTKPESESAFKFLGFKTIESVPEKLVFMEKGFGGIDAFIKMLSKKRIEAPSVASIVMNANPFTKGHLHLVTQASKENDVVHLFVLSEEMSAFPSATRFDLVKQGVNHLKNVYVHQTGSYMVSAATFPSYFLKEDDDVTMIQARLDTRIFVNHIAPALHITKRYVGSEPLSHATNIYNDALMMEFDNKLQLIIIDRVKSNESIISASLVRQYLKENKIEQIKDFVPETTYQFLQSDQGQLIIKELQNG